ncbi:hypothetical protein GGR53DRAFT_500242 [Hypoxylon sp. FL1150]|nr:hypothetical protein GGR53DRAFT_500242 [Hypoxylon sp. FL1150]
MSPYDAAMMRYEVFDCVSFFTAVWICISLFVLGGALVTRSALGRNSAAFCLMTFRVTVLVVVVVFVSQVFSTIFDYFLN